MAFELEDSVFSMDAIADEYNLTTEQLEDIRHTFNVMDKNGDGRLNVRELMSAYRAMGHNPTVEDMQQLLSECDDNQSGFIELHEYVQLMAERYGALDYEKEMMKAAFAHFDRDGSGYLSRDELYKYLTRCGDKLTDEEFQSVINVIDTNGDGKISLDEFTEMLTTRK